MKRGKGGKIINPKDHWIAVEVPPIIDRWVWETAQERKKKNRAESRRNTKREYLLRSRVKCELCGHKMGIVPPHSGREHHYFRCTAAYAKHYGYSAQCESRKHFRRDNIAWQWIYSFFLNPERLAQGYEQCLLDKEVENGPSNEQISIIDNMVDENQEKLDRLLDLYLAGDIDKDLLVDRKKRLEDTIFQLKNQKVALNSQVKKAVITREQIQDIQDFVSEIEEGLLESDNDIKTKREFFRLLDLQVTLVMENGEPVIDLECILGKKRGKESEFTTRTIRRTAAVLGFAG